MHKSIILLGLTACLVLVIVIWDHFQILRDIVQI